MVGRRRIRHYAVGHEAGYALAATLLFMISPAMLCLLTELRDFSKAPFMLSMLVGIGWLLKYRVRSRQLFFWAVAFGLLAGVGMGFRQDVFVFLPLALVVLAVSAIRTEDAGRWLRLSALPLCLACSYLVAWPMLGRMEGAAHPGHHLVQGFPSSASITLEYCRLPIALCHPVRTATFSPLYRITRVVWTVRKRDGSREILLVPTRRAGGGCWTW